MTRKPDPEKEAIEKLRAAAFHPSLDEVWNRQPSLHTSEEREALIRALRTERAMWRAMEERKATTKARKGANDETPSAPVGEEDGWND
jgi:hypothetical protein